MFVTQFNEVLTLGKESVIFFWVLLAAHIRFACCKVLNKYTAAGVSNLYRGTQHLNLCTLFGHSIALDDA